MYSLRYYFKFYFKGTMITSSITDLNIKTSSFLLVSQPHYLGYYCEKLSGNYGKYHTELIML